MRASRRIRAYCGVAGCPPNGLCAPKPGTILSINMPSITPVNRALIIANLLIYGLQSLFGADFIVAWFALWPIGASGADPSLPSFLPWQVITYGFLHASWWHVGFNMWALYMFGSDVEGLLGARRYLQLYFFSMFTAALTQLAFTFFAGLPPFPTVGASGAIFGVLLAFAKFFPRRTVILLIPPIPLPARVFVVLFAALELFLGVTGTEEGVAHFAHLGGLIGALILLRLWRI
jgi:membrane associated rhomboid family serine protease